MRPSVAICVHTVVLTALWQRAVAVPNDNTLVTCGTVIKLQHIGTNYHLHSHEVAYGSGSGQQSVTATSAGDDAGSYWIVKGPEGKHCARGTPIKFGTHVRLQHTATRRWLHSHHFPSPLTNNQEVSAFGDDISSDTGDVWIVTAGSGKPYPFWQREGQVQFKHEDTGTWLSSSSRKFGRPIGGQQEVAAKASSGKDTQWRTTEGVYFSEATA